MQLAFFEKSGDFVYFVICFANLDTLSLHSRRLEVADERENGRARGRHARGEGAPARKAPENRFNSHSVSVDISNTPKTPKNLVWPALTFK